MSRLSKWLKAIEDTEKIANELKISPLDFSESDVYTKILFNRDGNLIFSQNNHKSYVPEHGVVSLTKKQTETLFNWLKYSLEE